MSAFLGISVLRMAGAAFPRPRSHIHPEQASTSVRLPVAKAPTQNGRLPRVLAASRATTATHHTDALKVARMMWMLLDCGGRIVRTGEETMPHIHLRRILEARFPGICTSEITLVPGRNLYGQPIRDSRQRIITIACVWLVPGSPLPGECSEPRKSQNHEIKVEGVEPC